MRHLPRTIQLDASDASVFEQAAEPGEWAVTGSFAFLSEGQEAITGKRRQAFRNGFLGLRSFGWSTLVTVAPASDADVAAAVEALAQHFVGRHGAPGLDAARPVAVREVAFAESLCEHPAGTMLTVQREWGPDGLIERFGTVARDDYGLPFDLLALASDS